MSVTVGSECELSAGEKRRIREKGYLDSLPHKLMRLCCVCAIVADDR